MFITGRNRTCDRRFCRSNPSLHHATNSSELFLYPLAPLIPSSSSAHTRRVPPPACLLFDNRNAPRKFPGGISVHGLWVSNPRALRPLATEVTVNFAIPGTLVLRSKRLNINSLGDCLLQARVVKQSARRDRHGIDSTWLFSSCLIRLLFTLSEVPAEADFTTEVSQK